MIISATEMSGNRGVEALRDDIYAIGIQELEFWKRAVKKDNILFEQLFHLIFSDDHRLAWRCCWIIDSASVDFPELLINKRTEIIAALLTTGDGSLKRHFTRILCRYPIPENSLADLVNRCFELLSPSEPVAVRVNAMQLLFNTTLQLPELRGEWISVIENLRELGGSAGFMNRSEKLLRKLRS